MDFPLVTHELALHMEKCDSDYLAARMQALGALPNNPYGIEIKRFGAGAGLMARNMSDYSFFNRVVGLEGSDLTPIDQAIEWFRANGVKGRFDVVPSSLPPAVLKHLSEQGYYQSGFDTALYGLPGSPEDLPPPPGVTVRQVEREEAELFSHIYVEGFGFSTINREILKTNMQEFFGYPAARFYLALVDDTPAAAALLFLSNGAGYLATAATLKEFRGRGCQQALIAQRMADTLKAGYNLVTAHASFGGASQHNLERLGFRLAYTKAIWVEAES